MEDKEDPVIESFHKIASRVDDSKSEEGNQGEENENDEGEDG